MNNLPNQSLQSIDQLVEYYRASNQDNQLTIGIEWERSAIMRDSLEPVQYKGENGYLAILKKLVEETGWEIIKGTSEEILELQRGETRVTVEGDGRLELAGSPKENLHDLTREFMLHEHEVTHMSDIFAIGWIPMGLQPLHSNKEIPLLEQERYELLQGVGESELMKSMTKRCNGLTVNFSYTDEPNLIRKVQAAVRILPVLGAMFASSPLARGDMSGFLDLRRKCILNHAPQRTGLPKNVLDSDFSLKDWIDYYLDIPVLLIERDKDIIEVDRTLTFRDWISNGYNGIKPTIADFDVHVKTTWSDIRLRPSYIEYRVTDSVPIHLALSLPALIKGLVSNSSNWDKIEHLTQNWTLDLIQEVDKEAWEKGLSTIVEGRPLLSYAQELLTLSNEGLHAIANVDSEGEDESRYLASLKEQIFIKELSPAEEIVKLFMTEWNQDSKRVLEYCRND